jgi:hypothetical protein
MPYEEGRELPAKSIAAAGEKERMASRSGSKN